MDKVTCHITKKEFDKNDCHLADLIRPSLFKLIQKDYPDLTHDSHISLDVLNEYRKADLEGIINTENRELSSLEKEVLDAIARNQILSDNIEPDINDNLTFGQRVADSIAEFGGSWTFIIIFFSFLVTYFNRLYLNKNLLLQNIFIT